MKRTTIPSLNSALPYWLAATPFLLLGATIFIYTVGGIQRGFTTGTFFFQDELYTLEMFLVPLVLLSSYFYLKTRALVLANRPPSFWRFLSIFALCSIIWGYISAKLPGILYFFDGTEESYVRIYPVFALLFAAFLGGLSSLVFFIIRYKFQKRSSHQL